MTTTKEIVHSAHSDIAIATGIVQGCVKIIDVLDKNCLADSQLRFDILDGCYGIVGAMQTRVSDMRKQLHHDDVLRDLTVIRGELAGLTRRIREGR